MRVRTPLTCSVFWALLASSGLATAAEPEPFPISQAQRPLTLPRLMLTPEVDIDVSRREYFAGADVLGGMNLGASFGITDDIEVGALVLPLRVGNGVTFGSDRLEPGNLRFHGVFRMFHSPVFELGARLQAYVITSARPGAQLTASIPFRLRAGSAVRFDFALGAVVTARSCDQQRCDGGDRLSYDIPMQEGVAIGLTAPLSITVSPIERFYFGVRSGFELLNFYTYHRYGSLPLGFFIGHSARQGQTTFDVEAFVLFPDTLLLGFAHWNDNVLSTLGVFTAGLSLRANIDLR